MAYRDVDIPVKSETREWLIQAKKDMSYDQFLNMAKPVLEKLTKTNKNILIVRSKNAQESELSKDNMEVTAKNG